MLRGGRADGFVPHTVFWHNHPRWRRAPLYATQRVRGSRHTTTIGPPLLAFAWERVAAASGDEPGFADRVAARARGAPRLAGARARRRRRRAHHASSCPTSRGSTTARSTTPSTAPTRTTSPATSGSWRATAAWAGARTTIAARPRRARRGRVGQRRLRAQPARAWRGSPATTRTRGAPTRVEAALLERCLDPRHGPVLRPRRARRAPGARVDVVGAVAADARHGCPRTSAGAWSRSTSSTPAATARRSASRRWRWTSRRSGPASTCGARGAGRRG